MGFGNNSSGTFFAMVDTDMQILEESAECVYKRGYEQRLWDPPSTGLAGPISIMPLNSDYYDSPRSSEFFPLIHLFAYLFIHTFIHSPIQ